MLSVRFTSSSARATGGDRTCPGVAGQYDGTAPTHAAIVTTSSLDTIGEFGCARGSQRPAHCREISVAWTSFPGCASVSPRQVQVAEAALAGTDYFRDSIRALEPHYLFVYNRWAWMWNVGLVQGRGKDNSRDHKCGREMDLNRHRSIRDLHSQGLRVREIARQIGVSASTVSRTLQVEPNRRRFADLMKRIEALEQRLDVAEHGLRVCQQCLHIVATFAYQAGSQHRDRLLSVLQQWPGDYFRRLQMECKL